MTADSARKPAPEIDAIAGRLKEGKPGEAMALADAWLARGQGNPAAWHIKGRIFAAHGEAGKAIPCFIQAINHKPDFKEACADLARTLEASGQLMLAVKAYEHLLTMEQMGGAKKPPAAGTVDEKAVKEWFLKGEAFQQKGDWENAAASYRTVLTLYPDMPGALVNLGMALHYLRRYAEAEQTLLHALRVKPGFPETLNTLGGMYAVTGQQVRAIAAWRQVIAIEPKHLAAWMNIAMAFSAIEHFDEAIAAYEQALLLEPDNAITLSSLLHLLHMVCRWDRAEEIRPRMKKLLLAGRAMEPLLVGVHLPELQLENARRYVAKTYPMATAYDGKKPFPADARGDGKLRIGYLSGDFHAHATAYLISELFEKHDRAQFEIYAYSYGKEDASEHRARIVRAADTFRDVRPMDDPGAAELIRADGIDILVDLKGYTRDNRLHLPSWRPAPVQMHYLGFPGTTGANFIDYFISDGVCSPPGSDADFSECLIRLPHSYQINDRSRPLPADVPPRSAYGLPEEGFVFGDFNSAYKITREIFGAWMRLLAAVEGSVLWLSETHPEAAHNMRREAEKRGIDPARIVTAPQVPLAEHLKRYRHVDLFLDAFPVCGHTTASDALWCGVPVVTMTGKAFISRVAASLLAAVELPGLVAPGLAEYEALALALARDKEKLAGLRRHLEKGRMDFALFDSAATTRALEAAYTHAAKRHRGGLAPLAFAIGADGAVSGDS